MGLKMLYTEMSIFNQKILKYLSKLETEKPVVSGNSVCYHTNQGPILIEPSPKNPKKITMLLDDQSSIFGDLEKLTGVTLN